MKAIRRLALLAFLIPSITSAAARVTEKQIEVMRGYVGKTYWIAPEAGNSPSFYVAPSREANAFSAEVKESFQITEMVKGSSDSFYYGVRFASGKQGYINVNTFLDELNSTVVTQDPDSAQKRKATKTTDTEKKREEWIRAQPWPEHVKEAALKKQAVLGMNTAEVKAALGKPDRVVRLKSVGRQTTRQEQWVYRGGSVLTFNDGVLTLIQTAGAKSE
jgi:hypothetical protein